MLNERLKKFEYYQKKLPLYLQNSYGIVEQFHIIYELLMTLDKTEDNTLKAIQIFDKDYLDFINNVDGSYKPNDSDILEKLARLYGFDRVFDVQYLDITTSTTKLKHLSLSNDEMLTLLKAAIIQKNFDGSRETAEAYYKSVNLPIYMLTDESNKCTCNVYLNSGERDMSENIVDLFLAGMLTIKSAGIKYNHTVNDLLALLIWDSENANSRWDKGRWA